MKGKKHLRKFVDLGKAQAYALEHEGKVRWNEHESAWFVYPKKKK